MSPPAPPAPPYHQKVPKSAEEPQIRWGQGSGAHRNIPGSGRAGGRPRCDGEGGRDAVTRGWVFWGEKRRVEVCFFFFNYFRGEKRRREETPRPCELPPPVWPRGPPGARSSARWVKGGLLRPPTTIWGSSSPPAVSATAPTAYLTVPCPNGCEDGGNVTIGCFVNDFFPEPVTISWVSDVQGDQMTFPAVQNSDSFYSVSSQLTVPASSYDGQNFQCKVTHAPTSTSLSEDITGEENDPPTVKLLSYPTQEDPENRVLLVCLIEGLKGSNAQVEWLINQQVQELEEDNYSCSECSNKKATQWSQVNVSRQSWDQGAEFSCRVSHTSLKEPIVKSISTYCPEPELDVAILPPSLEDLYIGQNASITCVATNAPQDLRFSWSRSVGTGLEASSGEPEKQENGLYRLTSVLKVCAEEWNSGETFTCSVTQPTGRVLLGATPLTFSCAHPADVSVQAPSVYVFPPPSEELARQETATLTCLASGFRPRDILVTWTQQDSPVASGSFSTFGPQEGDDGLFSVYSKLSVAAADWQRGDSFACVVGHDGIPMNFVQKSLDKSTGKPTHVNVSVILSDADSTCY
uniref:Ig-like domain-containing protein n=1 Tax=Cairina moschata TaxID=8855 RepID=A0A8C3BVK6_CAIMO